MPALEVTHASPVRQPDTARADVRVIRDQRGRSVVARGYAESPLRLLMPDNAGHAAWLYTSSLGGGLVDGDHLTLDIRVCAGATAFVSTQASTKVYRSVQGTGADVHAHVEPGASLVVAPDPVVCFAASRYRQAQRYELDAGASLVLVDWLSSGRHATGERWAFTEYHSRLHVDQGGRSVVHDAVALSADDGDLAHRLGRFDVLGLALLLGPAAAAAAASLIGELATRPVVRRPHHLVTATPAGDGCLLRFASTSVDLAARLLRQHVGFVPDLLGDDPWARKW